MERCVGFFVRNTETEVDDAHRRNVTLHGSLMDHGAGGRPPVRSFGAHRFDAEMTVLHRISGAQHPGEGDDAANLDRRVCEHGHQQTSIRLFNEPAYEWRGSMPTDEEMMTLSATCAFFGGDKPIHYSTLYRGIAEGRYPKPVRIGPNTSRWLRS